MRRAHSLNSEFGDALITYELEGLLMKEAKTPIEIVVPQATIFSEHPAVVIDEIVAASKASGDRCVHAVSLELMKLSRRS